MPTVVLLASLLVLSAAAVPSSCAAPAAQPPPNEPATPEPVPTGPPPAPEPGEPGEPPGIETPSPYQTSVPTPDPAAPCCFTNPGWSGVCKVRPVEDETCASILAYLNNPRSTGKTYCDSSDVRGGWKPAVCEDSE
jgi:hypothetical protein